MGKFLTIPLILALLCPCSASAAADSKYIALTFEGSPVGEEGRLLLDGLEARGARATFFLWTDDAAMAEQIAAGDHEIGLLAHPELSQMSRRKIAEEFSTVRALLPRDSRIRLLRPGHNCSDGVYQVAEVTGLTILEWSQDSGEWAARDNSAVSLPPSARIQDGDVIRISLTAGSRTNSLLNLVDLLEKQGFRFITVSELALLRDTRLRPGRCYSCFPGDER